jgi:hypothetical protein
MNHGKINNSHGKVLTLRNRCAIKHAHSPMKQNSTLAAPTAKQTGRRSYNTRIDRHLIECATDFCARHNKKHGFGKALEVCDVIEKALLAHLRPKARKYGLAIPRHLIPTK